MAATQINSNGRSCHIVGLYQKDHFELFGNRNIIRFVQIMIKILFFLFAFERRAI